MNTTDLKSDSIYKSDPRLLEDDFRAFRLDVHQFWKKFSQAQLGDVGIPKRSLGTRERGILFLLPVSPSCTWRSPSSFLFPNSIWEYQSRQVVLGGPLPHSCSQIPFGNTKVAKLYLAVPFPILVPKFHLGIPKSPSCTWRSSSPFLFPNFIWEYQSRQVVLGGPR